MQILVFRQEWIGFWQVGRKPRRKNMGKLAMTNVEIFSPFVLSVDIIMGKDALVVLATL